jgi:hypothetical protein
VIQQIKREGYRFTKGENNISTGLWSNNTLNMNSITIFLTMERVGDIGIRLPIHPQFTSLPWVKSRMIRCSVKSTRSVILVLTTQFFLPKILKSNKNPRATSSPIKKRAANPANHLGKYN